MSTFLNSLILMIALCSASPKGPSFTSLPLVSQTDTELVVPLFLLGAMKRKNDYKLPQEQLELLMGDLRSFVSSRRFDYHAFRPWIGRFYDELSKFEFSIETGSDSEKWAHQIAFMKNVFTGMMEVSNRLRHYSESKFQGSNLICSLMELYVKVLVLHDSHGDIDLSIKNISSKISKFYQTLYFLGDELDKLPTVPEGVRLLFDSYFSRVKSLLESLDSQIPASRDRDE
ncbi:hypothetical protein OXX59_002058 [Metschnikowia pulcherrima]